MYRFKADSRLGVELHYGPDVGDPFYASASRYNETCCALLKVAAHSFELTISLFCRTRSTS